MGIPDFINFIKNRINEPLPGFEAHRHMIPMMNNLEFRSFTPREDTSDSAVLVLLTKNKYTHEYEVLLTLRSNYIRHSGQISCPGGLSEFGETAVDTALREAEEEIGLLPDKVFVIGNLSKLYVQPSNTMITPVLAYIEEINNLIINKDEVEEVFFVKLETLLKDDVFKKEIWNLNGYEVEVPFWNVHSTTALWGATAMILKELLIMYSEYLNNKDINLKNEK